MGMTYKKHVPLNLLKGKRNKRATKRKNRKSQQRGGGEIASFNSTDDEKSRTRGRHESWSGEGGGHGKSHKKRRVPARETGKRKRDAQNGLKKGEKKSPTERDGVRKDQVLTGSLKNKGSAAQA